MTAYAESLRIEPQYAPAWFMAGRIYARTGARAELKVAQENLQKLDPDLGKQLAEQLRGREKTAGSGGRN